ncbi:MAG: lipocalin family protein [Nitrospinota bacterium]|nr:lipocalin family protein [Nitrospinota bacterium]
MTYWEGAVRVSGEAEGKPVRGMGYVEMTGYAGAFRKKI